MPKRNISGLNPAKIGNQNAKKERPLDAREGGFRLYQEEKNIIYAAIEKSGDKKSDWMRRVLLAAARKELEKN